MSLNVGPITDRYYHPWPQECILADLIFLCQETKSFLGQSTKCAGQGQINCSQARCQLPWIMLVTLGECGILCARKTEGMGYCEVCGWWRWHTVGDARQDSNCLPREPSDLGCAAEIWSVGSQAWQHTGGDSVISGKVPLLFHAASCDPGLEIIFSPCVQ